MSRLLTLLSARRYGAKVLATQRANLLAYWPLSEASGSATAQDASGNGRSGAYSNVTLGAAGIGASAGSAASFNGSSSFCNLYSASLAGVFNGSEGSIACWLNALTSAAVSERIIVLRADGSNLVLLRRNGTNGQVTFSHTAAGTGVAPFYSGDIRGGYVHIAATWSKSGNVASLYLNGALVQSLTGLGTFAGSLASTTTILGAQDTAPSNPFYTGSMAHMALWSTPLSAAEIVRLATR